jgi:hypothetical protein
MDEKTYQHCPICGCHLFDGDPARAIGSMDLHVSYDICECCGCEFGLDDKPEYRTEWIEGGFKWLYPEKKPLDWDPYAQLENCDPEWNKGWREYWENYFSERPDS